MRVAVLGAGRMGRIRAEAAAAADCRVVTVCDPDRQRAAALATDCAADVGGGPEELPWADLDAVFVCTPPGSRNGIEREVVERGIALFVEKPLGVSVAQCEAVLEALGRRPVVTAVGYMNRYRESVLAAREVARASGVVGMSCDWLGTRYGVPWWAVPELSGGPINEQATHLADLGRFIAGEIESVQCIVSGNAPVDRCASAVFNLQFAGGGLYSLLYSCDVRTKMIGLRVFTPDREVQLHGWDFSSDREGGSSRTPEERNAVFVTETRAFLDTAAGRRAGAVLSDYADAARTQAVVDTMRRAAGSGKTERVP